MNEKYAIKHLPTGKYAHLTFRGLDGLNLGWNPKLYDTQRLAELDLNRIQLAIDHNHEVLNNTDIGVQVHSLSDDYKKRINESSDCDAHCKR